MPLLTDPPPRFVWDTPTEPRACQLCDHRDKTHPDNLMRCGHREARGVRVYEARALGGFCGPDAKHLTFPGLRAPLTPSELTP